MITFKPILRKIQPIDFCRFLICYLDIHIDKNSRKDAFVAISLTLKVTLTRLMIPFNSGLGLYRFHCKCYSFD